MLAKGSLFEPSTRILSPPIRDDGVNESHLSKDQGDGNASDIIWGSSFDPTGPVPHTGVTRYYNFIIQRASKSPDGVVKNMLLVNNQFPGPLIEANWGDIVEVTVHNAIDSPKEGTSIHWHGLPQSKTPWYDGVPSVQQCPIAPGESFTYSFQAEAYGTSWWHSHYSAQYIDGLFGPMIIHGPQFVQYDIDLGPIQLIDYTHTEYFSYLLSVYHIPPDFLPIDNNLINGRMPFNCSLASSNAPCTAEGVTYSKFHFETGKTHLLRLINVGGNGNQKFSIDDHDLVVVANDFVPIQPYTTKVVTLGVGQRSDVLVKATGKPTDAVWMRSELDVPCLNVTAYQPNAKAIVYYTEADTNTLPATEGAGWESNNCANDPLSQTVPLFPKAPGKPDVTKNIDITVTTNQTGNLLFYVNNSTFYADYGMPLLREAFDGKTSFPDHPEYNVANMGNATSIRLIVSNYFPVMHNMHLHGKSNFWVLAEGTGEWDGVITNPENPQRRDGQQLGPGTPDNPTFIVIQWEVDNPGVWPFHCHLVVHASAGLYMNIIERPDLITDAKIPEITEQTCQSWNTFTANNDIRQIDSGLRHRREVGNLEPKGN
ncbi:multicopper oxidase-domain-containing protein [Hypoxylon rubiginosum]|uniref:Multicopper oxidase-domain-containing protein n=1 Tax=Hypoxylon rubiginosum TaxID=110542 RepID=A0ACC0CJJ5_9PEZI|nr:multicopper oxidase-domain-containing protein [Hypoxylon rubiginosum]